MTGSEFFHMISLFATNAFYMNSLYAYAIYINSLYELFICEYDLFLSISMTASLVWESNVDPNPVYFFKWIKCGFHHKCIFFIDETFHMWRKIIHQTRASFSYFN